MAKQTAVPSCDGILFSHKQEKLTDTRTARMGLRYILVSKRRQTQKATPRMIPCV